MIKDIFFSLKDNVKQKTTNPFFGTLIIVWIIHNWQFVYSLFNFEKEVTLQKRINFLKLYLEPLPFAKSLGLCILITIGVLISSYLLLNISRLIVNLYDKKLTPWIYMITDKTSIVLRSEYEDMKSERDLMSQKLETEREYKLKLQSEISNLEDKIKTKTSKVTPTPKLDKKELNPNAQNSKIATILTDIEKNKYNRFFEEVIDYINNDQYIPFNSNKESLNYFLRLDLLTIDKTAQNDLESKKYDFTELGNKVREKYIVGKMNKK